MEDKAILKDQDKMKIEDLVYISMSKLKDVCKLLEEGRYEGACYNGGYVVECIIKYIFLSELNLTYYNKEKFKPFVSSFNKLKKLIAKEQFFEVHGHLTVPEEMKAFLNIINNDENTKIIYEINVNNIQQDIEKMKVTVLKHLNEINKDDETLNASNMKKLEDFKLKVFQDLFEFNNYEDLEEYKKIINDIYKKVLTEHAFKKAIEILNEKKKSDINLSEYKSLLCWWEQWRYRGLNQECRSNKVGEIDNRDFCIKFVDEMINIINKILSMGLIPEMRLRRYIQKNVKEAKICILNSAL
jgi:HEPN domain-containing protein